MKNKGKLNNIGPTSEQRKNEEKVIKHYLEIIKYIEWLLKPNIDENGIDLHAGNIYVNEKVLEKFNITERELRQDITARFPSLLSYTDRIKDMREDKVVNNAMVKRFDSTFAKFLLSNKYNWVEKTENKNVNLDFDNFNVKDLFEIEEDEEETSDD